MVVIVLYLLFGHVQTHTLSCEQGWTEYDGQCYKHFNTPNERLLLDQIRAKCKSFGGDIATGATIKERTFLETLNRLSYHNSPGEYTLQSEAMLIGITRINGAKPWMPLYGEINRPLPFCGFPKPPLQRLCVVHRTFEARNFCFEYAACGGNGGAYGFRRYACKTIPGTGPTTIPSCPNRNTVAKDGKCVCKDGYVDIRESDALDRKNYKEAEECVPKEPCHSIKNSVSIIFIVDSSQSIQAQNWPSVVDFVKSGARLIPNKVNVGFIKFSTNVSFAEWLPIGWSIKDFQQKVPTDFDAGYTNTPAAIEKAVEMFDEDGSQDKVAVLITDGLPVPNEGTDKQKALADTEDAVAKLRRKRIKLVALGFGPELKQQNGYSYIKKWLGDPEEDYFSFDRMACDLKTVHMQILLQKVCRRYV